jgi:hypothetical protein
MAFGTNRNNIKSVFSGISEMVMILRRRGNETNTASISFWGKNSAIIDGLVHCHNCSPFFFIFTRPLFGSQESQSLRIRRRIIFFMRKLSVFSTPVLSLKRQLAEFANRLLSIFSGFTVVKIRNCLCFLTTPTFFIFHEIDYIK